MRVAELFKRLLAIEGMRVGGVRLVGEGPGQELVVDWCAGAGGRAARAAGNGRARSTTAPCAAIATWMCCARAACSRWRCAA
jgi:hypothetical protein